MSLFAELFNEMMMRDFGFRIYRALVEAPEIKDDEKVFLFFASDIYIYENFFIISYITLNTIKILL